MGRTVAHEESKKQKRQDVPHKTIGAKKRKFHSQTIGTRKILKEQKSRKRAICPTRFDKLARAIAAEFREDLRFQPAAMKMIQTALEEFIVSICRAANWARIHAKRETTTMKDFKLAVRMNEGKKKERNRFANKINSFATWFLSNTLWVFYWIDFCRTRAGTRKTGRIHRSFVIKEDRISTDGTTKCR